MRARVPLLALAAGALVLAGCTSPEPPAAEPAGPTASDGAAPAAPPADLGNASAEPEPRVALFPFQGKMTLGAGAARAGYVSPTGSIDPHVFEFPLEPGAMAIVAEVAWESRASDLDLTLASPSCDTTTGSGNCVHAAGGSYGAGDSPVKLLLEDPGALNETGTWRLFVWAKNAVNVEFEAAATVFYGAPPPEGYAALKP